VEHRRLEAQGRRALKGGFLALNSRLSGGYVAFCAADCARRRSVVYRCAPGAADQPADSTKFN